MTGAEIKDQIDANNTMIEQLTNPAQFTLNAIVANLLQENSKLQAECKHEFKDGICIYCYKEQEK